MTFTPTTMEQTDCLALLDEQEDLICKASCRTLLTTLHQISGVGYVIYKDDDMINIRAKKLSRFIYIIQQTRSGLKYRATVRPKLTIKDLAPFTEKPEYLFDLIHQYPEDPLGLLLPRGNPDDDKNVLMRLIKMGDDSCHSVLKSRSKFFPMSVQVRPLFCDAWTFLARIGAGMRIVTKTAGRWVKFHAN
jgi:hypothetical protein